MASQPAQRGGLYLPSIEAAAAAFNVELHKNPVNDPTEIDPRRDRRLLRPRDERSRCRAAEKRKETRAAPFSPPQKPQDHSNRLKT
jgi:hypothetical protein